MSKDKRVDEYINKSEDFAQPILKHLRKLIHETSPEISETIKWGMPFFEYKGTICSMAAFKQHCTFGFGKEGLIPEIKEYLAKHENKGEAMGSWGRIEKVADLPPDKLITKWLKQAVALNEQGVKVQANKQGPKPTPKMPNDFKAALSKNKKSVIGFKDLSPGYQREYIEWIIEAKTSATREKRIEQAVEWISEGKPRNWKYMRK